METVVLDLSKELENTHSTLYFDNFFNSLTLVEKLVQFEVTGKIWLLWKKIKIWKKVTTIFNIPITGLLWSGLIIVKWQWLVHDLRIGRLNTCAIPRDYQRLQLGYGWYWSSQSKNSFLQMDRKSSGGSY